MQNLNVNLDHPKLSGETTVQSAVTEVAAMVGENVKFSRGFIMSTTAHGVVCSYMHTCPQPGTCTNLCPLAFIKNVACMFSNLLG